MCRARHSTYCIYLSGTSVLQHDFGFKVHCVFQKQVCFNFGTFVAVKF